MIFHNSDKSKDLIYSIHSYVGDAHVTIYSNNTWYDIIKNKNVNEYKEINSFDINSYNEKNGIIGSSPYNNDYHNVILVKDEEINKLKNVSISQIFPTQDNYDISNKESKHYLSH